MLPADLFTPGLLLAAGIAAIGGIMRGFTGTGNSLLMTPLYALIFGPVPAVAFIIMFDVAVALPIMRTAYGLTRWRVVLPLVIAAWVTVPIGTWLLVYLDPEITKKIIAGVVICFSLILLSGWRYRGEFRLPITIGVGAVTGVFVGSTALGGPIWTFYILNSPGDHHAHRAAFNSIISLSSLAVLISLIVSGAISILTLWQAAVLFPVFASFIWVGSHLFHRANEQLFRRTVLMVMVGVGLAILFL